MKKMILLLFGFLTACSMTATMPAASNTIPDKPQAVFASEAPVGVSASIFEQPEGIADELLSDLQELARQRWENLTSQPGWLYRRTRNEEAGGDLSLTWQAVPGQYEQEEWLKLDGSGKIVSAVSRILDGEQNPVQVLYYQDGNWIDLTAGAIRPAGEDFVFDPNFGVVDLARELVQRGRPLHRNTIYSGCWYQGERYTISDGQDYYEIVFNPDRGSLRWIKRFNIVDGSIVLKDSLEMMVEQRIDQPPADVLAILESPAVP